MLINAPISYLEHIARFPRKYVTEILDPISLVDMFIINCCDWTLEKGKKWENDDNVVTNRN